MKDAKSIKNENMHNTYNQTKAEVLDRCKYDKEFREEMINKGILVLCEIRKKQKENWDIPIIIENSERKGVGSLAIKMDKLFKTEPKTEQ
jgi:hypothetical protein